MNTIIRSDLFRNFMGGFVLGALALFAMQPHEARAKIGEDVSAIFASAESHKA